MERHNGKVWRRPHGAFEQLEPRFMLAALPIISEFMASNSSSIQDGFGHHSDWIELTNTGDAPVNLQGYFLSDSVNNITKWAFPAATILNPNQFLIVFASDNNTVDPLGYYHTNYKLDADGEHVVLAAPDRTILSQICTDGSNYPAQISNVSYGITGAGLVNGDSTSSYLIPTNGSLGLTWTVPSFNAVANGFTAGKAAVGYDTTTTPINYANYFKTAVPPGTTDVYIRTEFNLANAASVTALNLNLKYDDGVVVYLNGHKVVDNLAPAAPVWNSLATSNHEDTLAVAGSDYSLTADGSFLQTGNNVLAIQLLNQSSYSSDLLVVPTLTAQTCVIGYLATPTPGAPNTEIAQLGPRIGPVVGTPTNPVAGQPIIVTARVTPYAGPVNAASVALVYRVMYGSEVHLVMFDDGFSGGDAVAGDGIYAASIPCSDFTAGQMVRWYVTAADTNGITSRAPSYLDPLDSPQYYGTVVVDPTVTTSLPVIYWFVQNTDAAASDAGTRASLYIGGQFYDNIEVDLHGQSTADPVFIKKSFNFDANSGLKFQFDGTFGEVSDFNLLTNYADKTYLRNTLAYGLDTDAGGPGLDVFSAVVERNGSYYGLYDVVEEAQSEFLERIGLDPDGALYKMYNGLDSSTDNVEKKTRKYEDNSDLQAVVDNASGGEAWIDDNLDLATWVNDLAVRTLISNYDFGFKNYYLYRDTNGTQQWSIIPWDVDLSFGHGWNPTEYYFDDDLVYDHKLYHEGYDTTNYLLNRLLSLPQFMQMYQRRLRSLMDEFYGPPGEDISNSQIVAKINHLTTQIGADALIDRNQWGVPPGFAFETPTQAIARMETDFLAKRKTFLNSLAEVPTSQVANPNVTFGTIDYNPVGGNQNQEYIAVVNHAATAVDISGWTISGAINHTFEGGTVIPAGATYYVVADVAQFKLRTAGPSGGQRLFIQGNYNGRLNDIFGRLVLQDTTNAVIASTTYGTLPLVGDYDSSGTVDNLDYSVWRSTFGSTMDLRADGNFDGVVDAADYVVWRHNLGATNNDGSGAPALAGPQRITATAPTRPTIESLFADIGSNSLTTRQGPSTLQTAPSDRSLTETVFQTWVETRDLALLAAITDRHVDFHRHAHDSADYNTDDAATTDCALADLLTLQTRPLLTAKEVLFSFASGINNRA